MFQLINSFLQAYSLQVMSHDAVHTLGSQCVYISEIFKQFTDVNTGIPMCAQDTLGSSGIFFTGYVTGCCKHIRIPVCLHQ